MADMGSPVGYSASVVSFPQTQQISNSANAFHIMETWQHAAAL
jgi:hypothetical protein